MKSCFFLSGNLLVLFAHCVACRYAQSIRLKWLLLPPCFSVFRPVCMCVFAAIAEMCYSSIHLSHGVSQALWHGILHVMFCFGFLSLASSSHVVIVAAAVSTYAFCPQCSHCVCVCVPLLSSSSGIALTAVFLRVFYLFLQPSLGYVALLAGLLMSC